MGSAVGVGVGFELWGASEVGKGAGVGVDPDSEYELGEEVGSELGEEVGSELGEGVGSELGEEVGSGVKSKHIMNPL